jgi:hypothetical protein
VSAILISDGQLLLKKNRCEFCRDLEVSALERESHKEMFDCVGRITIWL